VVNDPQTSAATYEQNNCSKRMKIEFSGEDGQHYEYYPLEFENKPYDPVFFENLFHRVDCCDFFDTIDPVILKVRLTIEEVYPGTPYDDTCISEITRSNDPNEKRADGYEWSEEIPATFF
jgi:hypothetical protein